MLQQSVSTLIRQRLAVSFSVRSCELIQHLDQVLGFLKNLHGLVDVTGQSQFRCGQPPNLLFLFGARMVRC